MSGGQYRDRHEAAQVLAEALNSAGFSPGSRAEEPLVLGLPRGGVPVAVEVAHALQAPWDVLVVRKIGAPGQPELAVGAVGEGGIEVRNSATLGMFDESEINSTAAREHARVSSRVETFRGRRRLMRVDGRVVIIVDDGLATGATMAAAVSVVQAAGARHITVAVPVGSAQAVAWMQQCADDVVCPSIPHSFIAVGQHYAHFDQVSDDEVIALLEMR